MSRAKEVKNWMMRSQRINRFLIVPVLAGIFWLTWKLDRHSIPILSWWTGTPENEIGDRGIEPSQLMGIGLYKLCFGIVVCFILAWLTKTLFESEKTGGWSRTFLCFALYLFCFSWLAAK